MRARSVRRGAWAAAMAVALAGTAWAGEPFEGRLSYQIIAKQGQPVVVDYVVKKGIVRVETKAAGAASYVIINPAEKKISVVTPAEKTVMEMAIPAAKPPEGDVKPPALSKTDKTEKVTFKSDGTTLTLAKAGEEAEAGAKTYEGQQWLVKTDKATVEHWVAKDLKCGPGGSVPYIASPGLGGGYIAGPGNGGGYIAGPGLGGGYIASPGLGGGYIAGPGGGTPYKTVTKDAAGKVVSEMVLVGVDAKSPDDELFQIPADYKKAPWPQAAKE